LKFGSDTGILARLRKNLIKTAKSLMLNLLPQLPLSLFVTQSNFRHREKPSFSKEMVTVATVEFNGFKGF